MHVRRLVVNLYTLTISRLPQTEIRLPHRVIRNSRRYKETMPESISWSSCLPPNQSTFNAFSSSRAPLELKSNQNIPHQLDSEPPEQPCTGSQAADTHAAAAAATVSGPETIIFKVEAIIESVIDGMLHKQPELAIPIRVKKKQQQQQQPRSSVGMDSTSSSSFLPTPAAPAAAVAWTRVLVRFPGRDGRESWRFS